MREEIPQKDISALGFFKNSPQYKNANIANLVLAVPSERNWTNEVCNFETGIPLGLEKLGKWEGIFQSRKSKEIEKKIVEKSREKSGNFVSLEKWEPCEM